MNRKKIISVFLSLCFSCSASAIAGQVKVTSLGSHDGEFCARDRAMLFEDPDGTRLLFDVGRTVTGADDPRLGNIDAVLLSGVHGDHIGDSRMTANGQGTCSKPLTPVDLKPVTNTVEIAVAKKARVIVGGEMHKLLKTKVKNAGGSAEQVEILRFGGERQVGGVKIAIVPVTHSNGLDATMLHGSLAAGLEEDGLTAYVGPDNGYILQFSNGLVVYLSGDSGISADQQVTVNGFYGAELAIINAGGIFTSGPKEAAYSINSLVKPKAVIPHHMNEAATENGKLVAGSRTDQFTRMISGIPVYLPISGKTMSFDGEGLCLSGC
jgi:L-ascorbate metabolism protein UlaG (beta-lactamase superfamily)